MMISCQKVEIGRSSNEKNINKIIGLEDGCR